MYTHNQTHTEKLITEKTRYIKSCLSQYVVLLADTFVKNPQYRIEVPELDNWKEGEKNILISLMQEPNLANRKGNQL